MRVISALSAQTALPNSRFAQALLLLALVLWGIDAPAAEDAEKPRLITTRALSELLIHPEHSAPATVISLNDSRISAEISARIESFGVKVGDSVQAGTTLVKLDCRDTRLNLKRTDTRRRLAKHQLTRAQSLRSAKNVSEELLDQRRTEYEEADIAYQQARLETERCTVKAPFEGIVMERLASEGERAAIGTPLLRLLDRGRLEISAQVTAARVEGLERARHIHFEYAGRRWPLSLRVASPAVSSQARNREVRLLFTAAPALPGTAGRVVWSAAQAHLPADLVVRRGGTLGVLIANSEQAHFKPLPGALEGQPAVITLPPATQVIIEGRHGLRDGDPVKILENDKR